MRCFYHSTTEAVAICKNCSRGVCRDCLTEFPNGIACKNRCEAEVEAVNQIINRGKTSYQKTSSAYSRNAIIYVMFAAAFGIWGAIEMGDRPMVGGVMLVLGIVFIIAALLNYSTSRKFMQSESQVSGRGDR